MPVHVVLLQMSRPAHICMHVHTHVRMHVRPRTRAERFLSLVSLKATLSPSSTSASTTTERSSLSMPTRTPSAQKLLQSDAAENRSGTCLAAVTAGLTSSDWHRYSRSDRDRLGFAAQSVKLREAYAAVVGRRGTSNSNWRMMNEGGKEGALAGETLRSAAVSMPQVYGLRHLQQPFDGSL